MLTLQLSQHLLLLKDKMNDNESDSDTGYHTPPEIAEAAKAIEENLLPSKSKKVRDDVQQINGVAR